MENRKWFDSDIIELIKRAFYRHNTRRFGGGGGGGWPRDNDGTEWFVTRNHFVRMMVSTKRSDEPTEKDYLCG